MAIAPYLRFARSLVLRDRPSYVHYAVTSKCNLKCRFCVIWKRDQDAVELNIDEVRELAGILARLGAVQVSLGGGEPATRKDLPEIVEAFVRHSVRPRVLTNGVAMTPAVARRLVDAGMRDISMSMDSLDPAKQEDLDAVSGTFSSRIDNLIAVSRLLPRRGCTPILNTVVTSQNYGELLDILELTTDIGFYVSFIPIHTAADPNGSHRFYSDVGDLKLEDKRRDELRAIYRKLLEVKRKGGPIINSSAFLERSVDYLMTGKGEWPCKAGTQFLSISPTGMVSPCHAQEGDWGFDFRDIERHFGTLEYKTEVAQRIASCEGCFRPCWAEVGFLMNDPFALLEMVRTQAGSFRGRPRVDAATLRARLGLTGGTSA